MYHNQILLWLSLFIYSINGHAQQNIFSNTDEDKLPYGDNYLKWEKSFRPTHTYVVSQLHPQASDINPGTEELPLLTINKAAEILTAGQRVLIRSGVYHETIRPLRGGESADKMIVYEAAEGEKVVVTGAVEVNPSQWKKSTGWQVGGRGPFAEQRQDQQMVWQLELREFEFDGYNPFGMLNLMHDQEYLDYTKVNMTSHFKKRGWVLADGELLEQVSKPVELMDKEKGAYWSEHNGMRLHVRFPDGKTPENCKIEITTKEQLFAPIEYGLGYIKINGFHFRHAANGFPVPQRGAVSASRGHHWIIEDCTIEGMNALGVDLGNEMWHTETEEIVGYHIFRRNNIINCGVAGLQGMRGVNYLIEDNLFENIGWHNVEHGWESGAIKLHLSKNTLIRRNVFRNIRHAPGIWLDYMASRNCRITRNVFTGITSARGAIYIEVSRELIHIDHNIIHNTRSQYWISGDYGAGGSALYTDGSDSIRFYNNLALDIENTGFGAYTNASRIVNGRGGTDRHHEVKNNIFIQCGKHGIEFSNIHQFADFNIYANMPSGYLKIKNPEPELLLDIKAWQDYYDWERNGKHIKSVKMELDAENLMLTFDKRFLEGSNAGPFNSRIDFSHGVGIDPRKK